MRSKWLPGLFGVFLALVMKYTSNDFRIVLGISNGMLVFSAIIESPKDLLGRHITELSENEKVCESNPPIRCCFYHCNISLVFSFLLQERIATRTASYGTCSSTRGAEDRNTYLVSILVRKQMQLCYYIHAQTREEVVPIAASYIITSIVDPT